MLPGPHSEKVPVAAPMGSAARPSERAMPTDNNGKENSAKQKRKANRSHHRRDEFIHMTEYERRKRLAQILSRGVLRVIGDKDKDREKRR